VEKNYTVDQVKVNFKSQRDAISNECKLITGFLKSVQRIINLKTELPEHDFKGQTIDYGSDVNFVCDGLGYKYVQVEDGCVLSGYENEIITKTTNAYVVSSDNKLYVVDVISVFANPIISNQDMDVRAGHYFLVSLQTIISYALNEKIYHSFKDEVDRDKLNKRISEHYSNQRIKFKIMPTSQKFKNGDSDIIKMLIKENILNKKMFFKKLARYNPNFQIVREVTRCNKSLSESKIMAVKGKKKAVAGVYAGHQSDVFLVVQSLYIKSGNTRVFLGKTEKIFPVQKFTGPILFTNITYDKKCWHNNMPKTLEFK